MHELEKPATSSGRHQRPRQKKTGIHIDSTPMADLAFLLLTFFILTTTFARLRTMDITMPVEGPPTLTPESRTITFLLSRNDHVFWYSGSGDNLSDTSLHPTDHSRLNTGIPFLLASRNQVLLQKIRLLNDSVKNGLIENIPEVINSHITQLKNSDSRGPIVLIKTNDDARYQNLVSMLNEMLRFSIPRYSIVELTAVEKQMLQKIENRDVTQ